MPMLSLVLPFDEYKTGLIECLKGIQEQSNTQVEVLMVGDNSSLAVRSISDEYAKRDSRFILVEFDPRGGIDSRTVGCSQAGGDYILCLEPGLVLQATALDSITRMLASARPDCLFCGVDSIQGNGKTESDRVQFHHDVFLHDCVPGLRLMTSLISSELLLTDCLPLCIGRNTLRQAVLPSRRSPVFGNARYLLQTLKKSEKTGYAPAIFQTHSNKGDHRAETISESEYFQNLALLLSDALDIAAELTDDILEGAFVDMLEILVFGFHRRYYRLNGDERHTLRYAQKEITDKFVKLVNKGKDLNISLLWMTCRAAFVLTLLFKKLEYVLRRKTSKFRKRQKAKVHHSILRRISATNDTGRVYLIGSIEHSNLGDHCINLAEETVLSKLRIPYIEIPERLITQALPIMLRQLHVRDVFLLQGGGNMGDIWPVIENQRQQIYRSFPTNKIVAFPQSTSFTESANFETTRQLLGQTKDMTMLFRDESSFRFAEQRFPDTIVCLLSPDAALSLNFSDLNKPRQNSVTFVLRKDRERLFDPRIQALYSHLKQSGKKLSLSDTATSVSIVSRAQRIKAVRKKMAEFGKSELIVTDRLHGMIFAYITGVPCIVFDNNNGKIKSLHDTWLDDEGSILFVTKDMTVFDIFRWPNEVYHRDREASFGKRRQLQALFLDKVTQAINGT